MQLNHDIRKLTDISGLVSAALSNDNTMWMIHETT